nr:restriction endonuclease subunit S [Eubacterium ramulus]
MNIRQTKEFSYMYFELQEGGERLGMKSEWTIKKLFEIADFNPHESLPKGTIAKKVGMDKLQPFCRDISSYEMEAFTGGTKFRNGDTIMARITPCLENGKTAKIDILEEGEIGFGSTEYIVFRAKKGVDEDFLYYLICSSMVREPAIKSMVGSSGRQRVQTDVVKNIDIAVPTYEEQRLIGRIFRNIDDKIKINNQINKNLEQQAQAIYSRMFIEHRQKSWSTGQLSDLISVKYGKDHKKLADGNYPVYGSGGIMRYVEKPLYTGESVLIPRKGTLNNVMYVNEAFWSVDTMFYTEMLHPNIAKFVYHFVKSKDLASLNAGSAVPSMTTNILNAMQLYIPDEKTLEKFENIVSPMYSAMQENTKESKILANTRDTLLPKLMSGELDISNIDL